MKCGQRLPDGAKFCMICGTPLGAVTLMRAANSVSSPSTDITSKTVLPSSTNTQEESLLITASHVIPQGTTNNTASINSLNSTFVPAMCPNCSAHMRVDTSSKVARCNSCGTECLVQDAICTLNVKGNVQVGNATINVNGTNTDNLLLRVRLMLSDGDFNGAMKKCDTILDSEPTNGRAYFYLLMSSLKCRENTDLANQLSPFDSNPYYTKAMQYGDNNLKSELLNYNNIVSSRLAARLCSIQKGEDVLFGNINGQAIRWKVLAIENNMILLFCNNVMQILSYHQSNTNITWEESTVRSWLNSIFFETCFTPAEQTRIVTINNTSNGSLNHFTSGGNITKDRVFLLSLGEVKQHLPFASARSIGQWWWLRSPGCYQNLVMAVNGDGKIHTDGYTPEKSGGIRPAIWIKIQ